MNRDLMKAMRASISEVLETMFFEPLEFPEEMDASGFLDKNKKHSIAVSVKYRGPFSGDLSCFMPKNLALFLASDFLGVEPSEVSDNQAEEVVKEIVNMAAGGVFSHYDNSAVFQLGIPEAINDKRKTEGDCCGSEDVCLLLADTVNGRFALKLRVM